MQHASRIKLLSKLSMDEIGFKPKDLSSFEIEKIVVCGTERT